MWSEDWGDELNNIKVLPQLSPNEFKYQGNPTRITHMLIITLILVIFVKLPQVEKVS